MKRIERVTGLDVAFEASRAAGCAFVMLGHGRFSLVDHADMELICGYLWRFHTQAYAVTKINRKTTYLHRLITGVSDQLEVDHINRNKLDNRRCNLRVCTAAQNRGNCGPRSHNKASRFKGVRPNMHSTRFTARGVAAGREVWLGSFKTEAEAAIAYNNWAASRFGEFASLNTIA